jgi:hypothetical protein
MRRSLTAIASILAGCLIIGLLLSRATVSQVAPVAPQPMGRYQVALSSDASGTRAIVVCDSTTGQCWAQGGGGRGGGTWRDLGTPTDARPERKAAEKVDNE